MPSNPLQDAVRTAADELKRKLLALEPSAPLGIKPAPSVEVPKPPVPIEAAIEDLLQAPVPAPPPPAPPVVPPPPATIDDLESLIQSEMSKPVEPGAAPKPEAATPPPAAPRVKPSFSPPPSGPSAPVTLPEEPSKAGILAARSLGFLWTGLIGVLTMIDRALPAPLKARKTLLGRVGIAATLAAMLGLGIWICVRVARG